MYKQRFTFKQFVQYSLLFVLVLTFLSYTLWQARLLIIGPTITLTAEPAVVVHERTTELSGYAANIVRITLNGRQIYTDKNGYFKEVLVLENGYTVATLTGTDRYGRTTSLTRTFVYVPITNQETE